MLLLVPSQLLGFGTFAKVPPEVPERITYSSIDGSADQYWSGVCDPAWSGVDGSFALTCDQSGCATMGCVSTCAKEHGGYSSEYEWCVPSQGTQKDWCWCVTQESAWPKKVNGYLIAPNVDLKNANLAGADLAGANLAGADLASANLLNADLQSANLAGANLVSAMLEGADFTGANLAGANLAWATVGNTNMANAVLTGADFWCDRLVDRANGFGGLDDAGERCQVRY
jgi:hypothetical protein